MGSVSGVTCCLVRGWWWRYQKNQQILQTGVAVFTKASNEGLHCPLVIIIFTPAPMATYHVYC